MLGQVLVLELDAHAVALDEQPLGAQIVQPELDCGWRSPGHEEVGDLLESEGVEVEAPGSGDVADVDGDERDVLDGHGGLLSVDEGGIE